MVGMLDWLVNVFTTLWTYIQTDIGEYDIQYVVLIFSGIAILCLFVFVLYMVYALFKFVCSLFRKEL